MPIHSPRPRQRRPWSCPEAQVTTVIDRVPLENDSLCSVRLLDHLSNLCLSRTAARATAKPKDVDIGFARRDATAATMRAARGAMSNRVPMSVFTPSVEAEFLVEDGATTNEADGPLRSACSRCKGHSRKVAQRKTQHRGLAASPVFRFEWDYISAVTGAENGFAVCEDPHAVLRLEGGLETEFYQGPFISENQFVHHDIGQPHDSQ